MPGDKQIAFCRFAGAMLPNGNGRVASPQHSARDGLRCNGEVPTQVVVTLTLARSDPLAETPGTRFAFLGWHGNP
jgi:hypothetical protein